VAGGSADLESRVICRVIIREGCRVGRWLTGTVMPKGAFPRVNRAGPRACQSPPWPPDRTRDRRNLVRVGAARPPVARVCSRAAGRADSVGVCCLSSRARGGAVRTGARSATTSARDPSGLTGACAGVASPAPDTRPVRSPPPASSPQRVRTPALTLCALLRPARRSVPRRTSVAHLP
jgi:hypothetical protein